MKTCPFCDHVARQGSQKSGALLCDLYPRNEVDPVDGSEQPPYWPCYMVLRVTKPNDATPCIHFKALPETGEPMVKEARGEKSVTYKKGKNRDANEPSLP